VKVLAHADRQSFQRFIREANTTASIPHRNVVRLLDFASNVPFLLMEFLDGRDLSARLKNGNRLATDVALRVARDVARALTAAHEAGVLHRDIKPMNIFLAVEGKEIVVKVLDFGIAKVAALGALTADGAVLGSPHYLAPEQIRNPNAVSARTDVWSLGVVLYRMLVGKTPHHDAESTVDVLQRVWNAPVPELAAIAPWVPPPVATMVRGLLRRNPELRPATMAEVLAQLDASLADSPLKDAPLTEDDFAPLTTTPTPTPAAPTPASPAPPSAPARSTPRRAVPIVVAAAILTLLAVAIAVAVLR
jgi:serine/threonine-protein kinase